MARESDDLISLLLFFLPQIPQILAWIVAMILAFVYWSRYPRVCLLTFVAMLILLLQRVLGGLLFYMLPRIVDPGSDALHLYFSILGIIRELLVTVAWVLIILAIFGWRKPQPAFVTFDDPSPPTPSRGGPRKDFPPSAIRE